MGTTMKNYTVKWAKVALALTLVIGMIGCGRASSLRRNTDTTVDDGLGGTTTSTGTNNTTTGGTTTTNPILNPDPCVVSTAATLRKVSPSVVQTNSTVVFEVRITCPGTFSLQRNGQTTSFSSVTTYNTSYANAVASRIESVLVNGTEIRSAAFEVQAPPPPPPPPPVVVPPTCSIVASPNSITYGRQTVTATLTVSGNATRARINGQDIAVTGGSLGINPPGPGTFRVDGLVENSAGANACSTTYTANLPPAIRVMTNFYITPENSHIVGGNVPPGWTPRGSFADCGMGNCFGNQVISIFQVDLNHPADGTVVMQNLWMTPENTHVPGGGGVFPGWGFLGSLADCGLGRCFGNQIFQGTFRYWNQVAPGEKLIHSVYVSAENAHVAGGGGCPANWEFVGSAADCGNGRCFGNQVVCVYKVTKP